MLIGRYLRDRRLELGMSEAEVAQRIGPDFQDSLLYDFESGDDSDIDGWHIAHFKAYCNILGVSPTILAEAPSSDLAELPLPQLVRRRREEKGYSRRDLSDLIGFDESAIAVLEGKSGKSSVCIHLLKEVALWLDLPLHLLLSKI